MRARIAISFCVLSACASDTSAPPAGESRADPLWTATATQPSVARADAPAVLLPSGRVLVAGGTTAAGPTSAVELFNPSTEAWQNGPALPAPQVGHVLQPWEGLAACVGGPRADALDGAAASWLSLGAPLVSRTGAAAATLADGRLLVVGGTAPNDTELLQADGGWLALAASTAPHVGHTATLLPSSGLVEVIGGPTAVAESFDVTGNAWTPRAGLAVEGHTASTLPSGELLLVGGKLPDAGIAAAQRFDPATGALTPVTGLRVPRASHTAAALPGGDVLVAGGEGPAAARSAERYIFSLDRFVASGCLDTPRSRHASVVLGDGGVMLVGGVGLDGGYLARSERLDFSQGLLAPGQPCALDCECGTGFCADGVCCDSACQGACLACSVAAGGASDGTCGLVGPSRICRAASGLCDAAERCTGVDAGCPADALLDAGATCRAAAGTCDVAELCSGASIQCPADAFIDAGTSCRLAFGVCDVPEVCTGAAAACPADCVVDAGTVCRGAAAGGCDVAEACDGVSSLCPTDRFADAGDICRPAAGACDLAESCTGTSPGCPADAIAFPGTVCRMPAGPCDVAEVCIGLKTCPTDVVHDAGVMCRAAAGACDVADVCDGVLAACPDVFADAGLPCRAAVDACDVADECDGLQATCPDVVAFAGTVCRPSDAGCDVAEVCDGVTKACPADTLVDAGAVCRDSSDACDAPESCDGVHATCPEDRPADAGTVCRPAAGACDDVEVCDGKKKSCPEDLLTVVLHPCRPSDGGCDVAEVCNGLSIDCPLDGFKEAGTACTTISPGCTLSAQCTGASAACPAPVCELPDAGDAQQHYDGWSCTCGGVGGAPGLLAALMLLLRKKRRHLEAARTAPRERWLGLLLVASLPARADAPVLTDFAVRVNASLLRDILGSQVGGELGANVSVTNRFDAAAAVSLGKNLGGRLGVTWHLRDDGEWVRPFIQARGLLHAAPDGLAAGAGAWGGVFVPLGPGRIQAGALVEVYAGPKSYVPYDAFVTVGYELDLYRRIERQGLKPVVPVVESEPVPAPAVVEPTPAPPVATVEAPPAAAPAPVPQPTRVKTHVSLNRDVITFEERRSNWDPKGEAVLRRVTEALKRYPNLKRVEVAGHSDDGDNDAECLRISQRRAEAVVKELVAVGVEAERLVTTGYGNTRTKVSSKGPARKRELNRRVDFTILEDDSK